MFKNKKILKTTAVFLLLNLLCEIFSPLASYALTSGPTTPEATNFEPVDGTDMINLLTGDLSYGVPLLEVPGPEGSYPLALSYHSGILPDEEASWVGLGWSLNPGAITRRVNGYADDHSVSRINSAITSTVASGKAIIADVAGSANGIGLIYQSKNGESSNGPNYAYFSAGSTVSFSHADIVAQEKKNQEDYQQAYSMIYGSIPTSDGDALHAMDDYVHDMRDKYPPTHSQVAIVPIPDDPNMLVYLQNNYFRYYKKSTSYLDVTGSVMANQAVAPGVEDDNIAFDSYPLFDPTVVSTAYNYNKADNQVGGSFPAYDTYTVSAQGLSGTMQPYIFENGSLYRENVTDNNSGHPNDLKFKRTNLFSKKVNFRFAGDFSNSLTVAPEQVNFTTSNATPGQVNTQAVSSPAAGYDASSQHLAGSKHIEWFTKEEIANGTAKNKGFISYQNIDNQPTANIVAGSQTLSITDKADFSTITGHIGGFMITNEAGITYHYALPVYAYGEVSFNGITTQMTTDNVLQTNNDPYAYQWMLTGVTGTDYVDRDNDGMISDADWGYWVSFGYGKWTDKYYWRTPDVGYVIDVNANNSAYSAGNKELYYLDYIRTRTHTALFMKDVRLDGRGVSSAAGDYLPSDVAGRTFTNAGNTCTESWRLFPVSVLKLNEIILLNNDDLATFLPTNSGVTTLNDLKKNGTLLNEYSSGNSYCMTPSQTVTGPYANYYINMHMGRNVLDVNDLNPIQYANLRAASLKTIQLNTDYSLCPGVPNSYDLPMDYYTYVQYVHDPSKHKGKLTLKSVKVLGVGGIDMMPATNFTYDVANPKIYSVKIINIPGELTTTYGAHIGRIDFGSVSHPFVEGDLIQFGLNSKPFYASLVKAIPGSNNLFNVIFTGAYIPVSSDKNTSPVIAYETKNPGFRKDGSDMWGMFKSDFDPSITSMNLAKVVSPNSAKSLDVWSLRQIETPIGAKINFNYEADKYKTPTLYNGTYNLNINSVSVLNSSQLSITFLNNPDLVNIFPVGSNCSLSLLQETYYNNGSTYGVVYSPLGRNATVAQVNSGSIIINSSDLVTDVNSPHSGYCGPNMRCGSINSAISNIIVAGNVRGTRPITNTGGGIRLSSVVVSGSGLSSEIDYDYTSSSTGISSGVTTYEPVYSDFAVYMFSTSLPGITASDLTVLQNSARDQYTNSLLKNMSSLFSNAREVPAPGVMYEYITTKEKVNGVSKPIYTKYQFQVFDTSMVQYVSTYHSYGINNFSGTNYPVENRMMKIKNYTSRIGALKNLYTYDNNNKLVARTSNKYLHDGVDNPTFESNLNTIYNNQGVVQQSFNELRVAYTNQYMAVTSTREDYPLVNIASETKDYIKGITKHSDAKAFDFYSGALTKTLTYDSYYNYYLTETVPAYQKYPEMGLKVITSTNRHMLSPSTATYVYKTDASGTPTATLSASVNTWNKVWNYRQFMPTSDGPYNSVITVDDPNSVQNEQIWRPYRSYAWNSPLINADGSYQNFVNFDWTSEANNVAQNKYWQKNSEVTLYDEFSNALEAKDVNGNYVSTKMGYKSTLVLANAVNSRFTEMAFTGAEDVPTLNYYNYYFGGELFGNAYKSSTYAHTGKSSIMMGANQGIQLVEIQNKNSTGRVEFVKQKKYKASVWVYKDFVTQAQLSYGMYDGAGNTLISSGSVVGNTNLPKAGNWYLLTLEFNTGNPTQDDIYLLVSIANTTSSNSVYFDDFRFHPVEAKMTSYVYDTKTRKVTHILDDENFYTRFEYDAFGRLTASYKETVNGEKKLQEYFYNYARKP